eukprot:2360583-Pyramimonas_sp.AAC.1
MLGQWSASTRASLTTRARSGRAAAPPARAERESCIAKLGKDWKAGFGEEPRDEARGGRPRHSLDGSASGVLPQQAPADWEQWARALWRVEIGAPRLADAGFRRGGHRQGADRADRQAGGGLAQGGAARSQRQERRLRRWRSRSGSAGKDC